MNFRNILVSLLFISALPALGACEKFPWSNDASITVPAPTAQKKWSRRKSFTTANIGNLATQFNGERIFFVARDFEKGGAPYRELILAINQNGEAVGDLEIKGKVKELSASGSGSHILAQTEDGEVILFEGFGKTGKRFDLGKAESAVLSHTGQFIALKRGGIYSVVSSDGKELWKYPAGVELIIFPFLNHPDSSLIASKGSVAFWEGGKEIWKRDISGAPIALSSAFLEGGLLAVSTGGEKGKIYFFNDKGEELGTSAFHGGAVSLSCSRLGSICAAYGNGAGGQSVALFHSDGGAVWNYSVKGSGARDSKVVLTGMGKENGFHIVAGFERDGVLSLNGWDEKGNPLWYAPVEGGARSFELSWSGKKMVYITENSVEFFSW